MRTQKTARGTHWFFLVDRGGGRLLSGHSTPNGRYHIDVVGQVDNTWEAHEHGRPSPRHGHDSHAYASLGHEDETMMLRFAKDVAGWLDRRTRRHEVERLAVVAPPRFLAALRQQWSAPLAARIEEREADLSGLGPGDLARHPIITTLATQQA